MDKQTIIAFTSEERRIIDKYAEEHDLSNYNAVKEIIKRWGESQK